MEVGFSPSGKGHEPARPFCGCYAQDIFNTEPARLEPRLHVSQDGRRYLFQKGFEKLRTVRCD